MKAAWGFYLVGLIQPADHHLDVRESEEKLARSLPGRASLAKPEPPRKG